ncbi:MAG: hypothetical protein QOJ35_995, partial [Solirubrobacteraceae bacterium]|nr:hypothetical protein [Solirubrobacteraceae bacterium]
VTAIERHGQPRTIAAAAAEPVTV